MVYGVVPVEQARLRVVPRPENVVRVSHLCGRVLFRECPQAVSRLKPSGGVRDLGAVSEPTNGPCLQNCAEGLGSRLSKIGGLWRAASPVRHSLPAASAAGTRAGDPAGKQQPKGRASSRIHCRHDAARRVGTR